MPRAIALSLLTAAGLLGALVLGALEAPADPAREPLPERVLLSAGEVGAGWDVVNEAPSDPRGDPDLVRWGVRAQSARHYTRDLHGVVQVCSLEVWAFEGVGRARVAHQGISYPDWEFAREGPLLLMVRGLTSPRGAPPRRGVFAACRKLGQRTRARAARLTRDPGAFSAAAPPPPARR